VQIEQLAVVGDAGIKLDGMDDGHGRHIHAMYLIQDALEDESGCGGRHCRGFSFSVRGHVAYYAAGEWSECASGLPMIHVCGSSPAAIAD
jgi:hypothetical protein